MTIVKHAAFSIEVSKREVFWLPVFLIFQHSQLFSTLFFTVFQHIFSLNSSIPTRTVFFKKILCSSAEYAQSGRKLPNSHAHFYCIPAWCVRIKTLYSSIACATFIKSFTPEKRTLLLCSSIFHKQSYILNHCQHFVLYTFPLCSSTGYVHFHCFGRLSGLFSTAFGLLNVLGSFLDCFRLLLGFWTALDCFLASGLL